MGKRQAKVRSAALFERLEKIADPSNLPGHADEEIHGVEQLATQPIQVIPDTSKFPRMKKFRFQLLHHWLTETFASCRAADIGGGKGLLSYLLHRDSWQATVIDPFRQALPGKYKDIRTGSRVKVSPAESIPWIEAEFQEEMAQDFDLLIAMHAHGCNVKIIDAAARYGCGFVIFPCCVIDEPFYPPLGVHWLESLASYAVRQGHRLTPIRLNFKGQNIGLVTEGKCKPKKG